MVRARARSGVALHGREKMSNTLQTGRRRCLHLQNRIERCNEMKKKQLVFFFVLVATIVLFLLETVTATCVGGCSCWCCWLL